MTEENNGYREQYAWKKIPDWDSPHGGHPDHKPHCDHPELKIIVRGQDKYWCPNCDWTFRIIAAAIEPWSWTPASAFFTLGAFVKQKGVEALIQGLLRPFPRRDVNFEELPEGKVHQERHASLPEGVTQEQLESLVGLVEALAEVDVAKLLELPDENERPSDPELLSQQVPGGKTLRDGNRSESESAGGRPSSE